jgi:glycosyltransferase involved in cell wall biosynthesis
MVEGMSDAPPLQGVKVLFVLPSLGLAGAERQAFLLARHLARAQRADVHLLSLTPLASLASHCDEAGLPYSFMSLQLQRGRQSRLGQLKDVLSFSRYLRRKGIQVVLPYCMFQNILCALTWRLGGARVCIWNQRDEGRSRVARPIESLAVRQVRRFISNSQHGADFLTRELGIVSRAVDVVPNGIELPTLGPAKSDWRPRAGIPAGSFVATMVANLHAAKDHATLIAAWRLVADRWPLAGAPHLLLAGDLREQYQPLVDQVRALGIESLVHFFGEVRDVDDLLRDVDLAVFSSYKEGIPNSVLEAMAHARAVAATDYPGIREAVGPEGSLLLARVKDPQDLADKILLAASDDALRARFGRQGRARIEDVFSVSHMAERMTDVIITEWQRSQDRFMSRLARPFNREIALR